MIKKLTITTKFNGLNSKFLFSSKVCCVVCVCTSLMLRLSMSIRESSLSWSGVMVVEVTGRASCLGGAAAVHTSLTCQTGLDK